MRSNIVEGLFARIRRLRSSSLLLRLVTLGACAWITQKLVLSIAAKYDFHFSLPFLSLPATLFLIPAIASIVSFLAQTRKNTAVALDRQFRLKERLVTYVEFCDKDHPFAQALCKEIETRISKVTVPFRGILFGLQAPAMILLLLLSAMIALPYLPVPATVAARQQEQKQIKQALQKLNRKLQQLQRREPRDPQLARLAKELSKIAQELEKSESTRADTFKKLNMMQKLVEDRALHEAQDRESQLRKAFAEATKENDLDPGEIERLLEELDSANGGEESMAGHEMNEFAQKGKMSREQAERLKEAIADYKANKLESEQELAELEKSLKETQKEMTAGPGKFTTDSKLSDKDLDGRKSGVDEGPGTTNLDIGPQSFDTKKKDRGKYIEDRTKAEYEQLYEGQRENVGSEPLYLDSKWNSKDGKYTRIRSFGLESESSLETAGSELAQQNQIESEVRKEKIPAAYRKMVKKYLESIE